MFGEKPRPGGKSPAEAVYGLRVRDCLAPHRRSFAPDWQRKADILEKKRERRAKELRTENFNRRAHPLQPLQIGDHVVIQHPTTKCWATAGVIVEVGEHRGYMVKTPAARLFRRNRRMLRRRVPILAGNLPTSSDPPVQTSAAPTTTAPLSSPPIVRRCSTRRKLPIRRYPSQRDEDVVA